MKINLFFITLMSATVAFASDYRASDNSSTHSLFLVNLGDMTCSVEKLRDVLKVDGQKIIQLCEREYRECMFYGSCLVEDTQGKILGLNYHKYDPIKDQSFFSEVNLQECPFGYGFGKVSDELAGLTCSIPYFSASADPLEHNVGDVIFIPSLVGVKLPTGEIHDGYIIITDYADGYVGAGFDQYSLFTGTENIYKEENSFASLGFSDPSTSFNYEVVSGPKVFEVQKNRGFKVLKTFKKTFKKPENPMLDYLK